MENEKIAINNQILDLTKIKNLINQNRKVEAAKLVFEEAHIGLAEAKRIVENIAAENYVKPQGNNELSDILANNVNQLDLTEILELLRQNNKVEAVKYAKDILNIGLAEAKNIVENIQEGNFDSLTKSTNRTQSESVNAQKSNSIITVTYTDKNGYKTLVNPGHALWSRVKKLMPSDPILQEYEQKFSEKTHTEYNSSVFIEEKKTNWVLILLIIAALATVGYFVFKKFNL